MGKDVVSDVARACFSMWQASGYPMKTSCKRKSIARDLITLTCESIRAILK